MRLGARWGCSGRHRTETKWEVWSRGSREEIERDKGRSGLGCLVSIREREGGQVTTHAPVCRGQGGPAEIADRHALRVREGTVR